MTGEPRDPALAELARRQEELVRALVAGAPLPDGFDRAAVGAAARALRNKRFGEVAHAWPSLLPYRAEFHAWAEGRPSKGSLRDGWEFARAHRALLDSGAATDLAVFEARWRHGDEPRERRGPVVRRAPRVIVLGFLGRVIVLRRRRLGSRRPRGGAAPAGRGGAMRIGVLTGGGDCPGLNAAIRAIVRRGVEDHGDEFLGFRDGWRGPLERDTAPLDPEAVRDVLALGGTILGSSRTNPLKEDGGIARIRGNLAELGVDALIAIGGEDTLGVAQALHEEGVPVVGVPKTIDNDLSGTDYTFGFDTAVAIATEAADRLRTTAESHHRALVCEVMGRHAGWIALHAGLASGADVVLVPEKPFDVAEVTSHVEARFRASRAALLVVSEGARPAEGSLELQTGERDAFGHVRLGGVGELLAGELERRTGREARSVVLGHLQRGGTPTAYDRVLATRFGLHAADAVRAGEYGTMVALRGTDIVRVPLAEAVGTLKTVPPERYAEAEIFFG